MEVRATCNTALLDEILRRIQPVDVSWIKLAEARQLEFTKPPGSLGRLETVANQCAGILVESGRFLGARSFRAEHFCLSDVSANL